MKVTRNTVFIVGRKVITWHDFQGSRRVQGNTGKNSLPIYCLSMHLLLFLVWAKYKLVLNRKEKPIKLLSSFFYFPKEDLLPTLPEDQYIISSDWWQSSMGVTPENLLSYCLTVGRQTNPLGVAFTSHSFVSATPAVKATELLGFVLWAASYFNRLFTLPAAN